MVIVDYIDEVSKIKNFKYPDHITQEQKDNHKLASYKYIILGIQIEMFERAMNTYIRIGDNDYIRMTLPLLTI